MLEKLQEFGLGKLDARIYVYLAKKGPQPEKDLAEATKITEQQLLRTLANLKTRGFVASETKNQTVLIALPIEEALNNILKAKTEETQRIEQNREDLLSNMNG